MSVKDCSLEEFKCSLTKGWSRQGKKNSQQQWRGKFTARNTSFAHLVKRLPFKITPYLTWPKISIMRPKIRTASPPSWKQGKQRTVPLPSSLSPEPQSMSFFFPNTYSDQGWLNLVGVTPTQYSNICQLITAWQFLEHTNCSFLKYSEYKATTKDHSLTDPKASFIPSYVHTCFTKWPKGPFHFNSIREQ